MDVLVVVAEALQLLVEQVILQETEEMAEQVLILVLLLLMLQILEYQVIMQEAVQVEPLSLVELVALEVQVEAVRVAQTIPLIKQKLEMELLQLAVVAEVQVAEPQLMME